MVAMSTLDQQYVKSILKKGSLTMRTVKNVIEAVMKMTLRKYGDLRTVRMRDSIIRTIIPNVMMTRSIQRRRNETACTR